MKKIIIAVLLISSVCLAQHPALSLYSTRLTEGRPFFTHQGIYDNYHLAGSPIGLFEIDSSSMSLEAKYSLFDLDNEKRHYTGIPFLRLGEPGKAYFQLSYGPDFLSYGEDISLPLHRFGLTIAAQSESGLFRASFTGSGYIGTQSFQEYADDTRAHLGLENLRLDFGSLVHPMARVGVFIGAGLFVDTLKSSYGANNELSRDDRSAHVVLPALGGFVDFGGEDFPARSHLSLQYASSRFVYVVKDELGRGGVDGLGNMHSIKNDSLQLLWLAAGRVPVEEHFVKFGVLVGFSNNKGKLCFPHEDSDPFNMGHDILGGNFELNEVYFGIGTGFELFNYADLFMEYVRNTASLNYGDYFPNTTDSPVSKGLNHFSLGVSTPIHEYLPVPFHLTPRIAYFVSQSTNGIEARRMSTDPLNTGRSRSKMYLYGPQYYLDGMESVSGFTLGVDAHSPDVNIGGSFYTTFLNKRQGRHSGIDMGLSFTFAIPGSSSGTFGN